MPTKSQQQSLGVTLAATVLLCSCGSPSSSSVVSDQSVDAATAAVDPTVFNTEEIAALIYDTTYSVPESFFADDRATTSGSYTMHHVLDDSLSFELCTDDYETAATWEADDNASRSVQGYFVGSIENDRYFEFVRELSYNNDVGNINDVTSPGFARVLKCDYADRAGVDRSALNGYAGHLKDAPLNTETVRVFAEYLWQFRFFPTSARKVLASDSYETTNSIDQTLLLAFATPQGAGMCDQIEVAEWRFSADRSNGRVHKYFETQMIFEARNVAGAITICD